MAVLKMTIGPTKGLKDLIKRRIEEVIEDNSFKKEVGQEVVHDIQRNARTGNSLLNGKVTPMATLQRSTIKHRQYLREAGNATARPYLDQLSNLSVSGQLIDSVGYKIDGNTITIKASGSRTPYITKSGRRSKAEPISNEDLSRIHHKGNPSKNLPARPFISLRDEMRSRIIVKMREFLRRSFKMGFIVKDGS